MARDPVPVSANPDNELTESQIQAAQTLMDEMPRIETALKNYLSLKMAQSLAPVETPTPEADTEMQPAGGMDAAGLQGCARAFLRALNALELPPVPEWGRLHPQQEAEGGLEFMTRLGEYKVTLALWSRCRGAGQKPAKMLGKTGLRRVYPYVVEQLFAGGGAAVARVEESQLRHFVDSFGATLTDNSTESDAALVWATNVNAAVSARQQARQEAATDRAQRATTNDEFSAQLRTALGSDTSMCESSVRIEEVAD